MTSSWSYRTEAGDMAGVDLAKYQVLATDGPVGTVDKHSDEAGGAYVVVDVGGWILGRHVLLPIGTVCRIDVPERTVEVDLTKEQIKNSPEFDRYGHSDDPAYHQRLELHYERPIR